MRLPIPQDWDGSTWTRFSICWPDSESWRALLKGFITYPMRGWSWKETTGIVTEAQAIGREIWRLNIPLEEVILSCKDANQLIKTNLIMVAALTGTSVNLVDMDTEALEAYLNQSFDFTSTGLANRIGPQVVHSDPNTLQATLERLKVAVEAISDPEAQTDWPGLFASLNQAIGDAMPIINNYVDCGGCSGGCNVCGGGGGTGGAGSTPTDPSDTQTDPGSQTGPPPDGFDDWEEYNSYKCNAATYIMNQIILDMGALGLLGIAGYTVSVLAPIIVTTILTPVPGDEVITIAFLMISIAVTALTLGTILVFLQDNFDELVCAMLRGSNVTSSIAEFGATVDSLMAEDPTINFYGPVAVSYAASLVKAFATIDSFNRMYDKQPVEYPDATCTCSDPGTLLKTAITEPYNVLIVGDDFTPPGDSTGWYVDTSGSWSFTSQVNTADVKISFEYQNSAPAGFGTGGLELAGYGNIPIFSDGDSEWEFFEETRACALVEDGEYSLVYVGLGAHGVKLRKILIESV